MRQGVSDNLLLELKQLDFGRLSRNIINIVLLKKLLAKQSYMTPKCTFCKIIENKIPVYKIHEDDMTLSFLDINPLARGHALVIPKVHKSLIGELSPDEASALFKTTTHLTKKIHIATETQASTIGINNGADSGQEVPHIHIHIIPRSRGDGGIPIHSLMSIRPETSLEQLKELANKILNL